MSSSVKYSSTHAPIAVLLAAKLAGFQANADAKVDGGVELNAAGGETVRGNAVLAKIAKLAEKSGLYGKEAAAAPLVDFWLDSSAESKDLVSFVENVNNHLQLRTFLVGHTLTIADLAVYGAARTHESWLDVVSSHSKTAPHFFRWIGHIESRPQLAEVIKEHVSTKGRETKAPAAKGMAGWVGSMDLNLPDVKEGEVVTRFPPEPSGYLHIGHVKAAILNHFYATKYKGKCLLRFDDTNPSKEKGEYTDTITEDLAIAQIYPSSVSYTSDYFAKLQDYAEQMIKEGNAFIDFTPVEQMREEKNNFVVSQCRNQTVEENLRLWNEMKLGTAEGLKCVMRGKMDPKDKNGALRDPSLYRCVTDPHYRTGTKFKAYPLYDFACPIVDSLEGVTHALRSSEYHDRNPLYYWVVDTLRLRRPHIEDFARLNFEYVLLSKRKLQLFVDNKWADGWDDFRFPTVRGIMRRGMTIEALREFIIAQGASKSLILMNMDKLWAINRKVIDPIVPRYVAIAEKVLFKLSNGPAEVEHKTIPRHKKNDALGVKAINLFNRIFLEAADAKEILVNEEITLMDWGNAIIRKINKNADGHITDLEGELHLEGDFKTTSKKLTWLADTEELIPVTTKTGDFLITKKKLEEEDKLEDWINKKSLIETHSVGDSNLRNLSKGERIQLERRGYFICDQTFMYPNRPLVLIEIPDGRSYGISAENEAKEIAAAKEAAKTAKPAATSKPSATKAPKK